MLQRTQMAARMAISSDTDTRAPTPMRLKPHHVMPVMMSAIMAFVMTAVITLLNLGLTPDFLKLWMHAFLLAWPIAAVAAFFAIPLAQRATRFITAFGSD